MPKFGTKVDQESKFGLASENVSKLTKIKKVKINMGVYGRTFGVAINRKWVTRMQLLFEVSRSPAVRE